jgi:peroxiredoxin Q/BCP
MLKPGDTAPDFTLTLHDGGPFRLSDWLGESHVVLYFFPKAFTAG